MTRAARLILIAVTFACTTGASGLAQSSEARSMASTALPQAYVRVGPGPRYLRIDSETFANRDTITSTEFDDLQTGRSVEYDTDRLGTSRSGFDGRRSWSTDDTGFATVADTHDGILSALLYARLSGRPGPEQISVSALPAFRGRARVRLRFGTLSGPIDITLVHHSTLIAAVDDFTGGTRGSATFSDYRNVANVMIPFRTGGTSDSGASYSIVRHARGLATVPRGIFSPPAPPHDAELSGTTSVPLVVRDRYALMVPISINGGPTLHVAFDSGSTNYVSSKTARRLGLSLVGLQKSGGVGAGLVDQQSARVATLTIGRARMHGIPFSVLDDGSTFDGTIGCEVLQRFAVQFDFTHHVVRLSRSPHALNDRGMPIPIQTGNCQAEVAAELDGMPGMASIDTGSGVAADIMSPFVKRHRLIARYGAYEEYSGGGIGGKTHEYLAGGRTLQIGPFRVRNLDTMLSIMKKGAFSDPTLMANLGIPLLTRFTLTLDYRSHRMWLQQKRSIRRVPFGLN